MNRRSWFAALTGFMAWMLGSRAKAGPVFRMRVNKTYEKVEVFGPRYLIDWDACLALTDSIPAGEVTVPLIQTKIGYMQREAAHEVKRLMATGKYTEVRLSMYSNHCLVTDSLLLMLRLTPIVRVS